jgi:hypothetical protein
LQNDELIEYAFRRSNLFLTADCFFSKQYWCETALSFVEARILLRYVLRRRLAQQLI